MKLCAFRPRSEPGAETSLGSVEGGSVFELGRGVSLVEALESGMDGATKLGRGRQFSLGEVVLGPPVGRPGKIVAAIVNTIGMLGGPEVRLERPRLDMKAPNSVTGPGEAIVAPESGIRPEVELAAVIGERISRVSPGEARRRILGYTILNDVTAPKDSKEDAYEAYRRDPSTGVISRRTLRGPLFRSKNHDTFCPIGPWIVTQDEFGDPLGKAMSTSFAGKKVQEGNTSEYIFGPAEIASYVSGFLTLEPGDVVSCGSVGWTREAIGDLDPTEYILPMALGTLDLSIEGIGTLTNPVVREEGLLGKLK